MAAGHDRSGIAALLGYGEFLIDTVVALALIVGTPHASARIGQPPH
jgi:hypothetical protein